MLAPRDEDDPERTWPAPNSRRRLWRNRGLIAALCTLGLLGASRAGWELIRVAFG